MLVYISDQWYGRLTVVPGLCHVKTAFVCAWWFPVLPRRSMLFFRDPLVPGQEAALPVRLSLRSVLLAYAKPICTVWAGFALLFAVVMGPRVPPDKALSFGLFLGVFTGIPCLLLLLAWKPAKVSAAYKVRLARKKNLPPHVLAALREEESTAGMPEEVA